MTDFSPREIVSELDRFIVGQQDAKRAVAIALRNRWRRQQLTGPMREEVLPKNILMIGPTGCGKTEIARRLARLAGAPFLKVEATKFTEVGYVGRDVDTIIRDLVDVSVKQEREAELRRVRTRAEDAAEERLLDVLVPPPSSAITGSIGFGTNDRSPDGAARQRFRKLLREGQLDDRDIEIDLAAAMPKVEMFAPPGMEELTQQLQGMFANLGQTQRKTRKMKIRDAMQQLIEEEAAKLLNEEDIRARAVANAESNGIVFLDEIDKIAQRSEGSQTDVSRQGVQRDLLPLVEGTTVNTKYGMVRTDHVLFIAGGAFHLSKPSDLIPELQGRFPIRVELESLSIDDFERILTSTDACLTRQYAALLATESVTLDFLGSGVRRLAEIAFSVNETTENIGARRLHTVMEKLLEEVSFAASKFTDKTVNIDAAFVDERLGVLAKNEDLARYVL